MKNWHQQTTEDVLKKLNSSLSGLKKSQLADLEQKYGKNIIKAAKQKSKLAIFLGQFNDVMIIILAAAAAISFFVGEHTDAFVIIAIILGNAIIGFVQENNAEEAVRMLQKMSAQFATVVRENNPSKIEASELMPGDIILLEAGDIVPADVRLLEVNSLKTEEAALTGESHSIEKTTELISEENAGAGDQLNMAFKGTIVSNGSAKAVVTTTGMETEIGKIAGLLKMEEQKTPLQKRLGKFSKQLAVIVIIICIVVFVFGYLRGEPPFLMFLTALSLAVAALPEALPAVITIALAKGARRMVKQNALVRKLPAVETLGSVTYICSDKTGTLTQNIMTVEMAEPAEGKQDLLLNAMLLNNEVRFSDDGNYLGDSTETALVRWAIEKGLDKTQTEKSFQPAGIIPFDSVRMRMSTLHQKDDKWILFTKGAPGKITEVLAAHHKEKIPSWLETNRKSAADGLRVLFFAYKEFDQRPAAMKETLETDMEFLGMTAMIDPPREEVIEAIRECKTAGIRTMMITGDQPLTAMAIAERLNITDENSSKAKTGSDLAELSTEELSHEIKNVNVFARVSPEQKLNIVKALQKNGAFVAMTGDGVNDAPSLKQADIGIAMGITGTDVSKESSDMILLDDNFATIVKAVKEGRRIYENIRKFILYVLSCNLSEILIIFFAPIIGFAIPLLPIHILWINLVTDGLPGIALVSEPAEKDIMKRPPRSPKENLFSGGLVTKIFQTGIVMTLAAFAIQWWAAEQNYDVLTQQTMVFTTLCFIQLANALSVRSEGGMFSAGIFSNSFMWLTILITVILQLLLVYVPALQPIFKTTEISWRGMSAILIVTLIFIILLEIIKLVTRKRIHA